MLKILQKEGMESRKQWKKNKQALDSLMGGEMLESKRFLVMSLMRRRVRKKRKQKEDGADQEKRWDDTTNVNKLMMKS